MVLDNLFQKYIYTHTHKNFLNSTCAQTQILIYKPQFFMIHSCIHVKELHTYNFCFEIENVNTQVLQNLFFTFHLEKVKRTLIKWRPYLIHSFCSLKSLMHYVQIEFKNLKMCINTSSRTEASKEFILAMEYRGQQGKQENFEP